MNAMSYIDNTSRERPRRLAAKFIIVAVFIVLALAAIIYSANKIDTTNNSNPASNNINLPANKTDTGKEPNQSTGSGQDNVPSTSGTGPGSNNSLLSQ